MPEVVATRHGGLEVDLVPLFEDHIKRIRHDTERALAQSREAGHAYEGIVFDAGSQTYYHADDHAIEFHPAPHFARFAPVAGPDHLLVFVPGARPRLVRVVPRDYWYEPAAEPAHPYAQVLDVTTVASPEDAVREARAVARFAYIGGDPQRARALGIDPRAVEPAALLAPLDWARAFKTPYEVACIREAARIASLGHHAVRQGVEQRLSERQLHATFLAASGLLESESPYTNIIAWDDRSSILHYQTKRTSRPDPGAVLLIDAGAVAHGYASDITRTYVRNGAHPVFRTLLDRMEAAQRRLVAAVRPGASFLDLHLTAHREIAEMLSETGVLKVSAAEAFERGLTRPFFPHGLGHHLGLQVHDIGGRQVSSGGEQRDPPPAHPYLRTTRDLAPDHVVTIEPGLYFIPMLLEPHREGPEARAFDWSLVDALVPSGGIRIEDDIRVTEKGHEDLTRDLVPGHLGA
jgi:Xaa-Pro dipeptidase